jgi:antitoxin component YwqK of YwqJK toxin-antitoxin module
MKEQTNQFDSKRRPHGVWENHWENGTLRYRHHYLHGQVHGLWKWYWGDGTLYFKRYYLTIK